jgi:hypothetical protein
VTDTTNDVAAVPAWDQKLRQQNLQVLRVMEAEKRQKWLDSLREHGDRVQFEEIKNTSIGK